MFALALALLAVAEVSSAPEAPRHPNVLAIGVGPDMGHLAYERVLTRHFSLAADVSYQPPMKSVYWGGNDVTVSNSWSGTIRPRWYKRDALRGPYLAGMVFYSEEDLDYPARVDLADGHARLGAVGGFIGWSGVFWNRLSLKAGIGAAAWEVRTPDEEFREVGPMWEIFAGIAF